MYTHETWPTYVLGLLHNWNKRQYSYCKSVGRSLVTRTGVLAEERVALPKQFIKSCMEGSRASRLRVNKRVLSSRRIHSFFANGSKLTESRLTRRKRAAPWHRGKCGRTRSVLTNLTGRRGMIGRNSRPGRSPRSVQRSERVWEEPRRRGRALDGTEAS